jgi:hypothetical protein
LAEHGCTQCLCVCPSMFGNVWLWWCHSCAPIGLDRNSDCVRRIRGGVATLPVLLLSPLLTCAAVMCAVQAGVGYHRAVLSVWLWGWCIHASCVVSPSELRHTHTKRPVACCGECVCYINMPYLENAQKGQLRALVQVCCVSPYPWATQKRTRKCGHRMVGGSFRPDLFIGGVRGRAGRKNCRQRGKGEAVPEGQVCCWRSACAVGGR